MKFLFLFKKKRACSTTPAEQLCGISRASSGQAQVTGWITPGGLEPTSLFSSFSFLFCSFLSSSEREFRSFKLARRWGTLCAKKYSSSSSLFFFFKQKYQILIYLEIKKTSGMLWGNFTNWIKWNWIKMIVRWWRWSTSTVTNNLTTFQR